LGFLSIVTLNNIPASYMKLRSTLVFLFFSIAPLLRSQVVIADSFYQKTPMTSAFFDQFIREYNVGNELKALECLDSGIKYAHIETPIDYAQLTEMEFYKAKSILHNKGVDESEQYTRGILKEYEQGLRKDDIGEGRLLLMLGRIQHRAKNYEESILTGRKAEPKIKDYRYFIPLYFFMADNFSNLGNYDSAIVYAVKSIHVLKEHHDTGSFDYVLALKNLSAFRTKNGNCENLAWHNKWIEKKLIAYRKGYVLSPRYEGRTYLTLSNNCFRCRNYSESLIYAELAKLAFDSVKGNQEAMASYLDASINAYLALGKMDSAYLKCLQLIPTRRSHIVEESADLSEGEIDIYINRKPTGLNQTLSLIQRVGNTYPRLNMEAFNYSLFLKGFAQRPLQRLRNEIRENGDSALIDLMGTWEGLRKGYYENLRYISENEKESQDAIFKKLKETERKLYRNTKLVYALNSSGGPDEWAKYRTTLDSTELSIEFVRYKNTMDQNNWVYGAFISHAKSIVPHFLYITNEDTLEKTVSRKPHETEFKYIHRLYDENSVLYDLVWSKILVMFPDKKRLIVSYSGILHGISHEAILNKQGHRLMDLREIVVLNSTLEFKKWDAVKWGQKNAQVLLFGGISYDIPTERNRVVSEEKNVYDDFRGRVEGNWNYLINTKKEVSTLEKLFVKEGFQTVLKSDISATESELKQTLASNGSPDILHFATHGFYLKDTTSSTASFTQTQTYTRSGLVLAGANTCFKEKSSIIGFGDGVITAPEISSLNLSNTKLVVLSACESGLGRTDNMGDVYGLQRAFKMAGAQCIIYTQWKVSDKVTMEFMINFYSKLMKSKNIHQAFYEAKKELSQTYSSYFWAPFQLIY